MAQMRIAANSKKTRTLWIITRDVSSERIKHITLTTTRWQEKEQDRDILMLISGIRFLANKPMPTLVDVQPYRTIFQELLGPVDSPTQQSSLYTSWDKYDSGSLLRVLFELNILNH